MEALVCLFKWGTIFLAGGFVLAIIEIGITEPFMKKYPKWFGKVALAFFILLTPLSAWAEEGRELTPTEIYEMQGGASQVREQADIPLWGSPEWHTRKAQFDKYEYKTPEGLSHWFVDGNGGFLTKKQAQAETDGIFAQMTAENNRQVAEMRGYVKGADGKDVEITKAGIAVLHNMQRDLKQQHKEATARIQQARPLVEYEKPKVLVSG